MTTIKSLIINISIKHPQQPGISSSLDEYLFIGCPHFGQAEASDETSL